MVVSATRRQCKLEGQLQRMLPPPRRRAPSRSPLSCSWGCQSAQAAFRSTLANTPISSAQRRGTTQRRQLREASPPGQPAPPQRRYSLVQRLTAASAAHAARSVKLLPRRVQASMVQLPFQPPYLPRAAHLMVLLAVAAAAVQRSAARPSPAPDAAVPARRLLDRRGLLECGQQCPDAGALHAAGWIRPVQARRKHAPHVPGTLIRRRPLHPPACTRLQPPPTQPAPRSTP